MATIGFIGVGNMGGPMVRNLVKAGHAVTVFDLSEDAMNYAVQSGATAAASAKDAAGGVEFAVTMLPVGGNVRDAYLNDGVIAGADAGTVLIDSSTIDVETAQAVHKAAADAGLAMIDAPVSGGTMGAEAGTLTFMCGGDKATFDSARAVLGAMGRQLFHCGGPGMGQATKICNNMIAGVSMAVVSEAFAMGEKLGLDRQMIYDVITTSTGNCWALEKACPAPGPVPGAPSSQDYKPGFAAKLMLKDLRLAQSAAQMAGTTIPLGATAANLFAMHVNNGNGDLDTASIFKMIAGDEA